MWIGINVPHNTYVCMIPLIITSSHLQGIKHTCEMVIIYNVRLLTARAYVILCYKGWWTPTKTQRAFSTFYLLVRLFEGPKGAFWKAGNDGRGGSLCQSRSLFSGERSYICTCLFSSVAKLSNDCENVYTIKPLLSVWFTQPFESL